MTDVPKAEDFTLPNIEAVEGEGPPKLATTEPNIDVPTEEEGVPADEDPEAADDDKGEALLIEDIPDLEDKIEHSLPNVEDYKANIEHVPHRSFNLDGKKLWCLAVVVVIVVVASIIGSVIPKHKKEIEEEKVYSVRLGKVQQFLFDNKVSALPYLKERGTSQHKAAAFVADGDGYMMGLTEENMHRFAERYILALFFYHFDGQNWLHRLNFMSAKDHCDWWRVYTSAAGREIRQGVRCDKDGRVVELNLSYNNLSANSIPHEIQFMGKLHTLHLYSNKIRGYIPNVFQNMKNLKGIGLMNTDIYGPIPSWIGEMTQLTTLALSNNRLQGTIPSSLRKLTNMKLLALDGNKLEGDISIFKTLTKVEGLFLDHNSFLGEIAGFEKMSNLISLDVSNNHLYGSIPNDLMNHAKMEVLDLSNNAFYGDFPDDILENDKLEYLSVGHNQLTGKFSARFGFVKNLKHLDISNNEIGGTIPDTLGQLTNLKYLSTSHNQFDNSRIPILTRLTNLVDLDMSHNNLHGTVPDGVGKLENLILLDFSSNYLTGSIPGAIGNLSNLNFLLLNRNKLSGEFPIQMTWLKRVQVLLLDKNDFKGSAQEMCDQKIAPKYFIADCYPGENNQRPEVECRCCTQCCLDLDYSCNNQEWKANVDLQYEYGYRRDSYTFSIRDVPVYDSDNEDGLDVPTDPNVVRLLSHL